MSKFNIKQEPWPLKKPLELLDKEDLTPYEVVSKHKIENEDMLDSLGTEDYIQWLLEDTEAPVDSPVRRCVLFITYYERADRVPHVPEECYVGAGHQLLASEDTKFTIPAGAGRQVPARHLVFQNTGSGFWDAGKKFSAFYLFSVNGTYANSRDTTRLALFSSSLGKQSYFSKVEWNFLTTSGAKSYLSKKEAIPGGEKLLAVVLPILEREYWPDEQEQGVAAGK
ncbi:MAG: hypothetical protein KAY65_01430 [Planctomycetes bacterium]|nr:hypothetical protein [Planctomycetota bacterium]